MPRRVMGWCRVPRCSERALPGKRGLCAVHEREIPRPVDRRPSAPERGYDGAWRQQRERFIAAHPVCQMHDEKALQTHRRWGDVAVIAHHVIALDAGGPSTDDNLLAVCTRCHRRIHGKDADER